MKGGSQLRTPDATCPGAREGSGMSLSHGQIAIRRRRRGLSEHRVPVWQQRNGVVPPAPGAPDELWLGIPEPPRPNP